MKYHLETDYAGNLVLVQTVLTYNSENGKLTKVYNYPADPKLNMDYSK